MQESGLPPLHWGDVTRVFILRTAGTVWGWGSTVTYWRARLRQWRRKYGFPISGV